MDLKPNIAYMDSPQARFARSLRPLTFNVGAIDAGCEQQAGMQRRERPSQ